MPHALPSRSCEKVGTDLFSLDGRDYVTTVDYLSNFWEVDRLPDTKSTTVIRKLKAHFARNGSPNYVGSDGSPQYMSEEFKRFAREWDFEHVTSSLHHHNVNGKAEAAVKMAKRTMRKCNEGNGDIYKVFLELRNTLSQGVESSPAQRLLGGRTRAFVPTTSNLLRPRGPEIMTKEKQTMERNQMKQAFHYNKTAKDFPILHKGDTVRMKPFQLGEKKWGNAIVNKRLDERSYEGYVDTQRAK